MCTGDWRQLQAADKIGSYLSARVETFAREVRKIRPDAKKQTAAAQAISKLMGAE